mgnify:CR=1 FL=1|jgi:ribonuclease VapC
MVIDTSALLAILKAEPDATDLLDRLSQSGPKWISTATLLEAQIVVTNQLGEAGPAELDLLLSQAEITPLPLDTLHVHWALRGWRAFGKGRHRAGLNLGDCFSYGLALALEAPLLFKGNDFSSTDVEAAL